jgi:hypothetical protein
MFNQQKTGDIGIIVKHYLKQTGQFKNLIAAKFLRPV